jgi:IMP dehydrogenase/GMP reductase
MAESPEVRYYREQKIKEEDTRKNRYKMAKAVREELLKQEKSRSVWQKAKDYFSGKVLESEKAHPREVKEVVQPDKVKPKAVDRTSQITEQLKKSGMSEEQIKKLRGK